jgi:hypothetical protein
MLAFSGKLKIKKDDHAFSEGWYPFANGIYLFFELVQ